MKQLIIMRHGQADSMAVGRDFDRPLTSTGQRDVVAQANWLRDQGVVPDAVIASPAKRTRQTAIAACQQLGHDPGQIHFSEAIYNASAGDLIRLLEPWLESVCLLLVGHNPGASSLVTVLADGYQSLYPASIARLEFDPVADRSLESGSARLTELRHCQ